MDKENVKEVFKIIKSVYPSFEVTSEKLNVWTRLLSDQEADVVIKNTESYAANNRFPPTISELRQENRKERDKSYIDKIKEWENNAVGHNPRS